jgi:predicted GH43/DUF377 family glycosyl hydrolase/predicted O-methyltransferase YrrM/GR25 family glycosyltransferase involved in LPS biosynthesis
MPPLLSLPCQFQGRQRLDWDRGVDLSVRREWYDCEHPDEPLGPIVTGAMGCGPQCPGYAADATQAGRMMGLAPLMVEYLSPLLPNVTVPAFNGSLVRYAGHDMLAYRQGRECRLAVMDAGTRVVVKDTPLNLLHEKASLRQEDPRLFRYRGRLYVSFTGVEQTLDSPTGLTTSVLYAQLEPSRDQPVVDVFYPHYADRLTWEKNWAFFESAGLLHAVYSIKPHTILRVQHDTATKAFETETPHPWTGGHLRGGSPPVLVGDEFYHFFHGRVGLGVEGIYNTGVYTFEAEPPFKIKRMTRSPIQWAEPNTRRHASPSVVFVGGAMLEEDQWVLSYGEHDQDVAVARFDRQSIEDRLDMSPYVLPPVWTIYCEELPERQAAAEAEMRKANVPSKWWRGIHGNTWGLMTQRVYTGGECPITPGHASLILNHYNLWQFLYETGVKEAIICEDDVILADDFPQRAADIIASLPPDADLCFLGHTGCCEAKLRKEIAPGLYETGVVYGTHCYYVRASAFPVLLEHMRELKSHIDLQLYEKVLEPGLLKWYTAVPELASQGSANGRTPGTLGGSPWPGIPQDLRDELADADKRLAGWCSAEKARVLAGLMLMVKPKTVVEIGTFGGKSLLPMALALRHVHRNGGPPGIIYAVDPWTYDAADEFWEQETEQDRKDHRAWWLEKSQLEVEMQNCIKCITHFGLWPYVRLVSVGSEGCAQWFDNRPIQVAHVDGNHATEAAIRDVKNYLPRLADGGYLVMDDVGWPTVQPAVKIVQASCRMVLETHEWHLYRKV